MSRGFGGRTALFSRVTLKSQVNDKELLCANHPGNTVSGEREASQVCVYVCSDV